MLNYTRIILFAFIFIVLPSFLYSTIINIPADYATITLAMKATSAGDTILVQPGTYVENINFGSNITIGSLFLTTQDTTYISSTIIDGNASGSVITFGSVDSTAVLSGFTITNGSTTASGGGIYCNGASPTLINLVIKNNSADVSGGGMRCYINSNPSLINLIIKNNYATYTGGGISCQSSSPTLKNVVISGNIASINYGGGIYCGLSSPTLENVTIENNTAGTSGGAIYSYNASNPNFVNSILWNNSPEEIYTSSALVTATYSDIQGGYTGTGNIDSDPLFIDATNGDYHLQSTSPCIDAGDPTSPLDPDGTIVEMGAYYQYAGPVWHISTSGSDDTGTGSEEYPFATIQHGINTSANADTVLVKPGTYIENIDYDGKNIVLGSLFLTTRDTTYISSTVIDGDFFSCVVRFSYMEDSTAVLCGFTITNGRGDAVYGGGGIYCQGASPTIKNVAVVDNFTPMKGGGIYCDGASPILKNVIISNNTAHSDGGGIFSDNNSNLYLSNVTISDNTTYSYGGGICCYSGSPILENVTITGNTADFGGGICLLGASLNFKNLIIWNNSQEEIYDASGPVTATYSDIQGGYIGVGNIDSDPLFVDPNNGDYRLQSTSPCIDAGDPSSPLDSDSTRADMGACYFHQIPIVAKFVSNLNNGYSPLLVDFNDLSTQAAGVINEWYWDFGDGENSTDQNPTHIFNELGYHSISLTVTDTNDSTDIEIKTDYIAVSANEQPASPANVNISSVGNDVVLNWDKVEMSVFGNFVHTDYYLVYNSLDPYSNFSFQDFIADTSYTHQLVSQFSDKMFYKVSAYVGDFKLLENFIATHPKFKKKELDAFIEEKKGR